MNHLGKNLEPSKQGLELTKVIGVICIIAAVAFLLVLVVAMSK